MIDFFRRDSFFCFVGHFAVGRTRIDDQRPFFGFFQRRIGRELFEKTGHVPHVGQFAVPGFVVGLLFRGTQLGHQFIFGCQSFLPLQTFAFPTGKTGLFEFLGDNF